MNEATRKDSKQTALNSYLRTNIKLRAGVLQAAGFIESVSDLERKLGLRPGKINSIYRRNLTMRTLNLVSLYLGMPACILLSPLPSVVANAPLPPCGWLDTLCAAPARFGVAGEEIPNDAPTWEELCKEIAANPTTQPLQQGA